jgi:hypothetical protein
LGNEQSLGEFDLSKVDETAKLGEVEAEVFGQVLEVSGGACLL